MLEAALGLSTSREAAIVRQRHGAHVETFAAAPPIPGRRRRQRDGRPDPRSVAARRGPRRARSPLGRSGADTVGDRRPPAPSPAGGASAPARRRPAPRCRAAAAPGRRAGRRCSSRPCSSALGLAAGGRVLLDAPAGAAGAGASRRRRPGEAAPSRRRRPRRPARLPAASAPAQAPAAPPRRPPASVPSEAVRRPPAAAAPQPAPGQHSGARPAAGSKPAAPAHRRTDAPLPPATPRRPSRPRRLLRRRRPPTADRAPDVSFRKVKLVTQDGTRRRRRPDVVLMFGDDRLSVTPAGGGTALRSVRYAEITARVVLEDARRGASASSRARSTCSTIETGGRAAAAAPRQGQRRADPRRLRGQNRQGGEPMRLRDRPRDRPQGADRDAPGSAHADDDDRAAGAALPAAHDRVQQAAGVAARGDREPHVAHRACGARCRPGCARRSRADGKVAIDDGRRAAATRSPSGPRARHAVAAARSGRSRRRRRRPAREAAPRRAGAAARASRSNRRCSRPPATLVTEPARRRGARALAGRRAGARRGPGRQRLDLLRLGARGLARSARQARGEPRRVPRGARRRTRARSRPRRGLLARPRHPGRPTWRPERRRSGQILGLFLPFLLVTMSLLGGFYPAIDLTAGEKERGTMQTLLCAPVSPLEIVTGKYLAVWVTSLIAALRQRRVARRHDDAHPARATSISVSPSTLAAGVRDAAAGHAASSRRCSSRVATFAKDFKDGQNFLTPVYMLLALPAGVTMLRGIELNAWTAFVPVVNIALLIKALLVARSGARPHLPLAAVVDGVRGAWRCCWPRASSPASRCCSAGASRCGACWASNGRRAASRRRRSPSRPSRWCWC